MLSLQYTQKGLKMKKSTIQIIVHLFCKMGDDLIVFVGMKVVKLIIQLSFSFFKLRVR